MSITTRQGDAGETGLMFGKRIRKDAPRVHASGSIDELNASLGIVRAGLSSREETDPDLLLIASIQDDLVSLMGQLNTEPEDWQRYTENGYAVLEQQSITRLDDAIAEIESALPPPKGWSMPGAAGHLGAAQLEISRTVCRRAERYVLATEEIAGGDDFLGLIYLNRLSDLLWLLARRWELEGS